MARSALLIALSLDCARAVPYHKLLSAIQPSEQSSRVILPEEGDKYDWKELVTIDGAHRFDRFGWAVDISRDGQVAAIGSPRSDQSTKRSGSVRVFRVSNGTTWVQMGDQFNGEKQDDNLGFSVSLSKDGMTLAIGSPLTDETGHDSGSVRVYTWNEQYVMWEPKGMGVDGKPPITGDGDESDQCGFSISLSADGNYLAVGMPFNDPEVNGVGLVAGGVARVYSWDDDTKAWSLFGNEIQGLLDGDNTGAAVRLNDDATVLAVGSPKNNNSLTDGGEIRFHAGNARIFEWDASTSDWVQRGDTILGADNNDRSGNALALSATGNIVAIGSANHNGAGVGEKSGSMRVFQYDGTTYNQLGSTILGEGKGHKFGTSVAMASEGTLVAVGAPFYTVNVGALPNRVGRVATFAWNATTADWVKIAADVTGDRSCDSAGWSTSISADGTHLIAGIIQRGTAHPADYEDYIAHPENDDDNVTASARAFEELYSKSKYCSGAGEARIYAVFKCEFVTDWWGGSANALSPASSSSLKASPSPSPSPAW